MAGWSISTDAASSIVKTYTKESMPEPYGYPHYDCFDSGTDADTLGDADLLVPNLLNARVLLKAYAHLAERKEELEALLRRVPTSDLHLAAPDEIREAVGPIYRLLRRPGIWGVGGTTLSKVLHRKRPRFLPLFDTKVKALYFDRPDAPLHHARRQPWDDYMVTLTQHLASEIAEDPEAWDDISQGKVSRLGALDIVVWGIADDPARHATR